MVSTSDKGAVTILTKKSDYLEKMKALIGDSNAFTKLPNDPTSAVQSKNNRLIKVLHTKKWISLWERKRMTTYTSVSPRIYGQFKFHKPELPVRPIVSTIKSATHSTSRYLATILRKAFDNPFQEFSAICEESQNDEIN